MGQMIFVEGGASFMNDRGSVFRALVSSFYIGQYPVTQKEWQLVMGNNPSYFKGDDRPVEKITWFDAVDFCNQLSIREGLQPFYDTESGEVLYHKEAKGYRLPTEAEWEFAAKGGIHSKGYGFSGSDNLDEVGWYRRNSAKQSKNVGLNQANELGLYDMSGNVWEWCQDWYGPLLSSAGSSLSCTTKGKYRVIRGGSWLNYADFCRVDYRLEAVPGVGFGHLGFRLARSF